MKISKTLRFTIRIRDYENVAIEVGAEFDHRDLGVDDSSLSTLSDEDRRILCSDLEKMVTREVRSLAEQEVRVVADWSTEDNLAVDFLATLPTTTPSRSQHANNQKAATPASSGRRLRRR